jgi:hypothetical protein
MKTIKVIAFLLAISACSINRDEKIELVRAKGVPENAFWIGEADGGNWYLIEYIHDHRNNAVIKIYNDIDGSLIVSKRFILICPADNSQMFIEDLKDQISGFDGEKILLKSPNNKPACYLQ